MLDQVSASEIGPRRRTQSRDTSERMAARRVVKEAQRKLDEWHREMARLRALIAGKRGDRTLFRARAVDLCSLVSAHRIQFLAEIDALDDRIASHSIVRDALHSLETLRSQLETLSKDDAAAPFGEFL